MGQDCFWDMEVLHWRSSMLVILTLLSQGTYKRQVEQMMEYGLILKPLFNLPICRTPGTGGIRSLKWGSLLLHRQSLPRIKGRADQVFLLSFSSLFQRESCPIMKGVANQLCSPISVWFLAVPEAVSSHTKARRISSTRS